MQGRVGEPCSRRREPVAAKGLTVQLAGGYDKGSLESALCENLGRHFVQRIILLQFGIMILYIVYNILIDFCICLKFF